VSRSATQRQMRMKEAVDSLKRLFPAVHGRMTDLVQPTKRSYNVAMTVVMGACLRRSLLPA